MFVYLFNYISSIRYLIYISIVPYSLPAGYYYNKFAIYAYSYIAIVSIAFKTLFPDTLVTVSNS